MKTLLTTLAIAITATACAPSAHAAGELGGIYDLNGKPIDVVQGVHQDPETLIIKSDDGREFRLFGTMKKGTNFNTQSVDCSSIRADKQNNYATTRDCDLMQIDNAGHHASVKKLQR